VDDVVAELERAYAADGRAAARAVGRRGGAFIRKEFTWAGAVEGLARVLKENKIMWSGTRSSGGGGRAGEEAPFTSGEDGELLKTGKRKAPKVKLEL
jgi:hypothetical protein